MISLPTVTVAGGTVTLYALLAVLLCAAAAASLPWVFRRRGLAPGAALLFASLSAVLCVLMGRGVFCAVRTDIFLDPFGRSRGAGAFFDLSAGSLSVVGAAGGVLTAAFLTARLTGNSAARMLDAAVRPGLLLSAALRLIEPLSGQGYGPPVEGSLLCRVPFGIQNGWGEWSLSVCFFEALLLLILAAALKAGAAKPGTFVLEALALLSASQIIPESLRHDSALRIFIFARVNQIGCAALLFGCAAVAWRRGAKRGLSGKDVAVEVSAVLLGILLLIAGEFALDKTEWPEPLLYGLMLLVLAGMTVLILRRIRMEDARP